MPPLSDLPPVPVAPPLPGEPPVAAAPPLSTSPPLPEAPLLADELPPLPSGDDEAVPLEQPTLAANKRARRHDAGSVVAESAILDFIYATCLERQDLVTGIVRARRSITLRRIIPTFRAG